MKIKQKPIYSTRYLEAKYNCTANENGVEVSTIIEVQRCELPDETPFWEVWQICETPDGKKFEVCHTECETFCKLPTDDEVFELVNENYQLVYIEGIHATPVITTIAITKS